MLIDQLMSIREEDEYWFRFYAEKFIDEHTDGYADLLERAAKLESDLDEALEENEALAEEIEKLKEKLKENGI